MDATEAGRISMLKICRFCAHLEPSFHYWITTACTELWRISSITQRENSTVLCTIELQLSSAKMHSFLDSPLSLFSFVYSGLCSRKKFFFSFHSAAAAQQNSNVASHRKECGGEEISLLFFHATISAISYQIREECAATHGDLLCCYHGDAVVI